MNYYILPEYESFKNNLAARNRTCLIGGMTCVGRLRVVGFQLGNELSCHSMTLRRGLAERTGRSLTAIGRFTALQWPEPRSMLKAGRLSGVYGALRATACRPAKHNYSKKLQFRMVQISGGRAAL
jgi:hypothetical protein